jgi:hypothetical protein
MPNSYSPIDTPTFSSRAKRAVRVALVGFMPRDSALMVSIVRLLRTRLLQDWQVVALDNAVDCVILGSEATDQDEQMLPARIKILRVKAHARGEAFAVDTLEWPPRASTIEQVLNAMGSDIAVGRTSVVSTPTIEQRLNHKLLRWPPQDVLRRDPNYLRLAAAMVFRPSTVDELVAKTAVPRATVVEFLHAATAAGVANTIDAKLQSLLPPHPSTGSEAKEQRPASTTKSSGLFSLIRRRLGI